LPKNVGLSLGDDRDGFLLASITSDTEQHGQQRDLKKDTRREG